VRGAEGLRGVAAKCIRSFIHVTHVIKTQEKIRQHFPEFRMFRVLYSIPVTVLQQSSLENFRPFDAIAAEHSASIAAVSRLPK